MAVCCSREDSLGLSKRQTMPIATSKMQNHCRNNKKQIRVIACLKPACFFQFKFPFKYTDVGDQCLATRNSVDDEAGRVHKMKRASV